MTPRILFLVPSDYAALERKGVAGMILERDEHGFFDRVISVHPIAGQSRAFDLNPVHRVVEFDLGCALAPAARWWTRANAPFRAGAVLARLAAVIRRERIDLIRANDPYLMGLMAWILSRLTGRPFCVSIHVDYPKNFELTPKHGRAAQLRRLSAWCPSFVFRRADLVLPIRRHLAQWAESQGAAPERIRIIPHGIDFTPFNAPFRDRDIRERYNVPPDAPVVSFVGRLSRYNYVHEVLDVAERVAATHPRVFFVLMGDGEEREALERRLAASAARDRIRLTGFRPLADAVALRRVSAVSLCPMAGFSLIEACAAGSAVVTYDVDWHGEIITSGVTGLMVAEGDIDGLVAAVERLLDDPSLARRLGTAARAFAAEHHEERHTSDIKRLCYSELLAVAGSR